MILTAYTVTINHKVIDLPIAARLRIRPIPNQLKKVVEVFVNIGGKAMYL